MNTQEIECRFLEIEKPVLVEKLISLGAEDRGEVMLEETIIYDPEGKWRDQNRFVRLRRVGDVTRLTYKEHRAPTVDGRYEIEFSIEDFKKAELLFEKIGLQPFRRQEKKRHSLVLDEVTFDIDTWPRIPSYVELEGPSEKALKVAARKAGLDWKKANFTSASSVLENVYKIPMRTLRWFTFDRFE